MGECGGEKAVNSEKAPRYKRQKNDKHNLLKRGRERWEKMEKERVQQSLNIDNLATNTILRHKSAEDESGLMSL